ncbi:MAG: hypothetical protein NT007_16710 [Candidatus Kapabacteria bacterium]|nr:hypothetical protein [Candidatus Kapabacteria bacterium]
MELKQEISERLRFIRENLIVKGIRLSAAQFADMFDTSEDKIRNYENARSNVSIELLILLYRHGINPIFLLTGEGSWFAENKAGKQLASDFKTSKNAGLITNLVKIDGSSLADRKAVRIVNAAAGDIKASIKSKKK